MAKLILRIAILILMGGQLSAATSQESLVVQEMRLALEQMGHRLHSQNVEISLCQERAQLLENTINSVKQELKTSLSEKALEKRIVALEKANELLVADFKILKEHINETGSALLQCQVQVNKMDKQLCSDIQSLKTSLNTMIALLQSTSEESRSYTVKPGDSLGQIALEHKTDIKTLKRLNNLTSDTIYSGQKIILP